MHARQHLSTHACRANSALGRPTRRKGSTQNGHWPICWRGLGGRSQTFQSYFQCLGTSVNTASWLASSLVTCLHGDIEKGG